jgi:Flp pilus assembly protein TadG
VIVRPRLRRDDGGAALVEMAILLPVLILVVFGIIEWSAAYHDASVTADAARAGGRMASAESLNASYATNAASAVASTLQSVPVTAPVEMYVYKANSNGYPGSATDFSTCSTNCISYQWQSSTKTFNTVSPGGSGWPAASQQVCTEPFDEVGIYVKINHSFITNMFGATMTLTDHAVFRLEPTSLAAC